MQGPSDRLRRLHEVQAVAGLPEHPNVVKYFRSWQQDGHFWIQVCARAGSNIIINDRGVTAGTDE